MHHRWLAADLAAVDRSVTPWVVVGMHRPIYVDTIDSGDQDVASGFETNVEPLLAKYEVRRVGVWLLGAGAGRVEMWGGRL